MPAPHPMELRRAAVAAYESGEGTAESVAASFGVSRSALLSWSKRLREQGTLVASARGGGNFSNVDTALLMSVLAARRDGTTDELTRAYNTQVAKKDRVSRSSILRALKREGFVFKKSVRGPQNRTALTSERNGRSSSDG